MSSSFSPAESSTQNQPDIKPSRKKGSSQRATLSCTECSRRKTKCDKNTPCGGCIKRGKTHLCHVDPHGSKDRDGSDGPGRGRDLTSVADAQTARHAAFSELESFRTTVDLLRSRVAGLEGLLAKAFSSNSPPSFPPPASAEPSYNDTQTALFVNGPPLASGSSSAGYDYGTNGNGNLEGILEMERREVNISPGVGGGPSLNEKMADDLRGEEVEASVALEFLALGRTRTFGARVNESFPSTGAHRLPDPSNRINSYASPTDGSDTAQDEFLPSPLTLYPTIASLALAAPPQLQADAIVSHSLDWLGWHHAVVHAPTMLGEIAEFWGWGENRFEVVNMGWLALWYALLLVGVANLAKGQAASFGISEEERGLLAKKWFDCSMACLTRANFLQNHQVYSVQAIGVLVVTGQDASVSNLIPTLLATGISICQSMGLHRMNSDEEWDASTRSYPHEVRVRSLLNRETKKRVFWALTSQDWFSVLIKRTYIVQPTQVTTPLPLNTRDEDLLTGQLINRPPSEYCVTSKLLLWIQIARCLQAVFEHIDKNANPSYQFLLDMDEKLSNIITNAPSWLRDDGPTQGMPPCVDWLRTTFRISSNHKLLTLHRPFLSRAFKDKRFEFSRRRSLAASRAILREAPRCGDIRLWSIPYHLAAGATVVLLDLFQCCGTNSATLDEERHEVLGALAMLETMQDTSSIARRGVALISSLLAEEARLREERARTGPTVFVRSGRKRNLQEAGVDGREYTQVAKKMALSEISPPNSASTDHSNQNSPTLAAGYNPNLPQQGLAHFQPHRGDDPALFDFTSMNNSALPQEFLDVFLSQQFDPLDGAITSLPYDGVGVAGGIQPSNNLEGYDFLNGGASWRF